MPIMNRTGKWFPCFSSIRRLYDKHIYFSKAALFIFGLVFSHSLINYGVVKLLMDYLTYSWPGQHLAKAVAIINLHDGVSTISEVIVAHLADSYYGRFNMIVICTIAYITGLTLLNFSGLVGIYVGLLAVALGKSGQDPVLKAFLADQLGSREDHKDEEKIESRLNVWWGIAWSFGAIVCTYKFEYVEWEAAFIISIVVMDASLLLFCIGFPFYYNKKPVQMQSPLNICFRVFKTAMFNLHLNYPHTPEQFHKNCNNEIPLLPEVPLLRWLDKAAIAKAQSSLGEQEGSGEQDLESGNGLSKSMDSLGRFENTGLSDSSREEESHRMPCTVKEVSEVKCLLTLVPIWTNFFACGLVKATGDTFFMEQSSNLHSNSNYFMALMFILVSLIRYAIQFPFRWEKVRQKFGPLKRIGAGMVCSILCCITAWQVEIQRRNLIKKEGIDSDAQGPGAQTIPMNIFVLFPQFLLLGLMEGLGEGGLETFVDNHIPKSFTEYGSVFSGCVLGSAYFFSIPLLLLFRSWFGDTINKGHLESYFLFLAILNTIFFCFYLLALSKYAHMDPSENVKPKDSEEGAEEGEQSTRVQNNESMGEEPLPMLSYASTKREEVTPDDEPGSQQYLFADAEPSSPSENVKPKDSEEGAEDSFKSNPYNQWGILANATTAPSRFRRRRRRLHSATEEGEQSIRVQNHESMEEELPLMLSYASTRREEVAPDDEPGSQQDSFADAEPSSPSG